MYYEKRKNVLRRVVGMSATDVYIFCLKIDGTSIVLLAVFCQTFVMMQNYPINRNL